MKSSTVSTLPESDFKVTSLFEVTKLDFLGYCIDEQGVRPTTEKVRAIQDAPAPSNKQDLQAFLGLLNFYHCFLKDKATVAEPFRRLLDKSAEWEWKHSHQKAFDAVKGLLTADSFLAHYEDSLHLHSPAMHRRMALVPCLATPCHPVRIFQ